MRIAVYLRVSTDAQDETRQRKAIRQYLNDQGLTVAPDMWFLDKDSRDQAHRRENFQRLMRLVTEARVDTILIDRQDRFGVQDADEWFHYRYLLRCAGCKLIAVDKGEDLTAKDAATMVTTMFGAETSEREQIEKSFRVLGGKMTKAKEAAVWNGGNSSFGYDKACYDPQGNLLWFFHYLSRSHGIQVYPCDRCKVTQRGVSGNKPCPKCQRVKRSQKAGDMPCKNGKAGETIKLVPSEDQSRIDTVRQVYKWYTTYAGGTSAVAALCAKAGYTIYGRFVTHEMVRRILSNPCYAGAFVYGRTARGRFHDYDGEKPVELPVPSGGKRKDRHVHLSRDRWIVKPDQWVPLVDLKTWDKAQRKLQERATGPRPPKAADCWLKGILYCGHCRKPMAVRRARGQVNYFCLSYHKAQMFRLPRTCNHNSVLHQDAERLVLDYLAKLKIDLTTGTDREAILKLYALRGQKEDLLAQTIRKGVQAYSAEVRKLFGAGGRLGGMVDRLEAAFNGLARLKGRGGKPLFGESAVEVTIAAFLKGMALRLFSYGKGGADLMTGEDVGRLITAIEDEKATAARVKIGRLQAEYEQIVLSKALAKSDRERQVMEGLIAKREDEIAALEEHLTPLTVRRDELKQEIKALQDRIGEAEKALAEGENLAKAEAVRQVLGKVYLHFGEERRKVLWKGRKKEVVKSPLLPEKTEYETTTTDGLS
jgi:DNA invertase Pin-like site-specific DNA recombinase